jgi:RNA polymerase sigma factor (sigma-70 family)
MSALLQPPHTDGDHEGAVSDHRLVAAVRRGDDRAFEALYERYHRRIHAYVFGMVKDHQRAEDVTQEVFVSALRRMRATERPIAFKPWVYEIAKNACIDQFRRSRRAEEVSFDAEDGLAPSDYGRLVSPEPVPDVALAAKQQLDHLCGAFGGLSDAHHEILVLRELEGLSYREIGERMSLSRPAVESTLFRARRRLTEEYDELASGQRCLRIQDIIETASGGRLGARDTRRLARHVAHCQPCRRQAVAAGVDSSLLARRPVRERIANKVAGLLPFPLLLRGRRESGGSDGSGWLGQLPMMSDHASAGGAKLVAVAALLVAGVGAGVGTQVAPGAPSKHRGAVRTLSSQPVAAPASAVAAGSTAPSAPPAGASGAAAREHSGNAGALRARSGSDLVRGGFTPAHARRDGGAANGPGGGHAAKPGDSTATAPGSSAAGRSGTAPAPARPAPTRSGGGSPAVTLPAVNLPGVSAPQSTVDVPATVDGAVNSVGSDVTAPLTGAASDTVAAVGNALGDTGVTLPTLP